MNVGVNVCLSICAALHLRSVPRTRLCRPFARSTSSVCVIHLARLRDPPCPFVRSTSPACAIHARSRNPLRPFAGSTSPVRRIHLARLCDPPRPVTRSTLPACAIHARSRDPLRPFAGSTSPVRGIHLARLRNLPRPAHREVASLSRTSLFATSTNTTPSSGSFKAHLPRLRATATSSTMAARG
jgi:hypothetical protein